MNTKNTPVASLIALVGIVLSSVCHVARAAEPTQVYRGFTLLDPATRKRVPNAWVIVEGNRIAKIGSGRGPKIAKHTRVHDLAGKFLLPGFIDAHAHVTSTGILTVQIRDGAPVLSMKLDDDITEFNARMALARGVTTVRNPAGSPSANAQYDRKIASGEWQGPEAKHAGAAMQPPPFSGEMFRYPRTEAEWNAEAQREAQLGMKYFKLYTDLKEDELALGIQAAHKHGLKAIAHLNLVSWTRAIELGIDGLEHSFATSPDLLQPDARQKYLSELDQTSRYLYRWFEHADFDGPPLRNLVAQLAKKRIATNMTLVVNDIVYNIDDMARALPAWERQYVHPDVLKVYDAQMRASATGWTADDFARARAVMPKVLEFARRLRAAQVPMMIGTDSGGGVLLGREMELHREAGIAAWDVLRMATCETADIMELGHRIGRIKAGYEADLVILDADPLVNIRAVDRVHAVLNNGELLKATELLR